MELSIIIPAFEESTKIEPDLLAAAEFLTQHSISGEIIVVDDGSSDDTAQVAENLRLNPAVTRRVLRYEKHRGKGYAVRTGMVNSTGKFAMFIDSGLCVPYEYVLTGLNLLKSRVCEIAHASRYLPGSKIMKPHTPTRRISSRLFRFILARVMHVSSHLTDTQCGLKMYRGDIARALYRACATDGFMFDIEIILRAVRQGFAIREFPIEWTADVDSRLTLSKMPGQLWQELSQIKKMLAAE